MSVAISNEVFILLRYIVLSFVFLVMEVLKSAID